MREINFTIYLDPLYEHIELPTGEVSLFELIRIKDCKAYYKGSLPDVDSILNDNLSVTTNATGKFVGIDEDGFRYEFYLNEESVRNASILDILNSQ